VALTEAGALAQRGQPVVARGVLGDAVEQLPHRLAQVGQRVEADAELRLAAGALHEDHEELRRAARDLGAPVVLDQRERQSMLAVPPAEVNTSPSPTKIGPRSTVALGNRWARSSRNCQCVVARRPSSRPTAPSRNAPAQTDITRRLRVAPPRSAASNGWSSIACGQVKPPGTTSVSMVSANSGSATSTPIGRPSWRRRRDRRPTR
jgi:hypothetical protein